MPSSPIKGTSISNGPTSSAISEEVKGISPHEVGSGSKPILYRQVSWHPPSNASGKDESGDADTNTTSHITTTTRSGIAPPPSNERQQGYDMISPTHNRTSISSTTEEMTPTSVRSIQLAQLYHSSRRSRHACQSLSGNSSTMFSPIAPPPLAFPSSTPDPTLVPVFITTNANEEKIWKEMESAISNTAKEEWSFKPKMSNSMSSNSLSSMEMMMDIDDDMMCMEHVEVGEVFDEDKLREVSSPAAA